DNIIGFQRTVCLFCFAIARESPDEFAIPEIPGDPDPEYELVPSRQKVRRLALIGAARFDAVSHADWHVDPLVPVSVEIPEEQVERAVCVLFPTLVHRSDVQTRCRLLRARTGAGGGNGHNNQDSRRTPTRYRLMAARIF